jgi:predicted MFS family arabinose efflux permease
MSGESRAHAASLWSPFRHRPYAVIWVATLVANVGTWMYGSAAGWLMTTLTADPLLVSLVQVAATLPMFLFALPAGALADVLDARKLLIAVEASIIVAAIPFALLVEFDRMTPALLLIFTFLLESGAALGTPAWQSIVPRLVPREDLAAAVAANSVSVNMSRALGPALGGLLMSAVASAAPFWVNAFSNAGSIGALIWWRPRRVAGDGLPAERLASAIRTGLRFARNDPPLRATLVRAVGFFFFASAYWALLPLIARTQVAGGSTLYGVLLGAIGGGAVAGAFAISWLRAKLGADGLVVAGQVGTALAMALFGVARAPALAAAASVLAGVCWIAAVSTLNVSTQVSLAEWVRARGLAVYAAVMFGAMTLGSAAWGEVASAGGLAFANFAAAAGALIAIPLTWRWKLRGGPALDLSPSMYWPEPIVTGTVEDDAGPVMVTIEYLIAPANRAAFLAAKDALERQRRRGGGYAWSLFEDTAVRGRFVETFRVESWLEHLRQHDRATAADRALDERVRGYAEAAPTTTHFIAR